MTVSEIAEQVGIPVSSTYRILGILEERALVERTPDDKRVLGIRALQLGRQLLSRNGLQIAKVARPIMADLVNTTHETVILTALAGLDAISVESIEGIEPIRFSFQAGRVLPLYAGASGKILLAFGEESLVVKVLAQSSGRLYASGNRIEPAALRRQLSEAREQGYMVSSSEVDVGVTAIASPVLLSNNSPVAGLSVAGPSTRFGLEREYALAEAVKAAAKQIAVRYELYSPPSA